jgi:integrase/recombinase XerC
MAQRVKSSSYYKVRNSARPRASAPVTWEEAVKRFLAHLVGPGEASPYTYDHYSKNLDHFRAWWVHAHPDRELEPRALLGSDLKDWKDFLREEKIAPATDRERTRKAGTVNAMMAAVKSFLNWCADNGILDEPPVMPKRVKAVKPGFKALTRVEQNRLLRAIEAKRVPRDLALVLVLLDGGPRIAELCALRWRDVELSARKGDLYIWHGKGDKERPIPLSNRARKALLDLRGDGFAPDDPVFASRKGGKPLTPRAVQLLLERYAQPLGLKVSPHMLRHSFATDALKRGVMVTTVQAILGHRSVTTTLGYCNSSPEDLRQAVEREKEEDD